ncbi:MAG TPA: hypothetical protein VGQ23_04465 [Burkholderiaceae bacterium]|jgi:hypothetical protein|nr:hypothetical protein [Burkholderiaceae bacterium]
MLGLRCLADYQHAVGGSYTRSFPVTVNHALLVLVAALLHALWNIAAKKAGGGDHFVLMIALLIVALWAPLALIVGWDVLPRWGALEWGVIMRCSAASCWVRAIARNASRARCASRWVSRRWRWVSAHLPRRCVISYERSFLRPVFEWPWIYLVSDVARRAEQRRAEGAAASG